MSLSDGLGLPVSVLVVVAEAVAHGLEAVVLNHACLAKMLELKKLGEPDCVTYA